VKQLLVLILETNAATSKQNIFFPGDANMPSLLAALAIIIIAAFLVHPIKPPVRVLLYVVSIILRCFFFCRKRIYTCQCTSDISSDSLGDPYPFILSVAI